MEGNSNAEAKFGDNWYKQSKLLPWAFPALFHQFIRVLSMPFYCRFRGEEPQMTEILSRVDGININQLKNRDRQCEHANLEMLS
jgi:hypothetical protein